MTIDPADPAFALRIASFYARSPYAARTNTALGAIVVLVMWGIAPTALLLAWFGCVVANNLMSLRLHYAAQSIAQGVARAPQRWANYSTYWMLCAGVIWGGGAVLMFPAAPLLQAFWLVLVNGIAAGVVAANAYHRPAQLAYLLPLLSPLTLRLLVEGQYGGFEYLAIALGMALFLAFCLVQGRHQTRLIHDSVQMRFENLRLMDELRAQTIQADEARRVAERSVRDKARFFAAASHDLRQPLHALGLFTAALRQTAPSVTQAPLIERIESGIDSLEALFHDLLDISRIDAGAVPVHLQATPLAALRDWVQANFAASAQHKGLRFAIRTSKGLDDAWIHTDLSLLRRILANLLANAIRYTPQGSVALCLRRKQGMSTQLLVEVRDSGIGIDPANHQGIFDEFMQVENPGRNRQLGSGLGLATVRRLAALLGAPIHLRSAAGRGATFSFALPTCAALPQTPVEAEARVTGDLLLGARIAIIDDDALVLEGVARSLQAWGAITICAADSAALLVQLIDQAPPTVLLTDWMLASEDGLLAAERLTARYPGLQCILATADSSPERRALAQTHNLTLLIKPFQPARLRATLNALLATGASSVS